MRTGLDDTVAGAALLVGPAGIERPGGEQSCHDEGEAMFSLTRRPRGITAAIAINTSVTGQCILSQFQPTVSGARRRVGEDRAPFEPRAAGRYNSDPG